MKKYSLYAFTLATLLAGSACNSIWGNTEVPEAVKVQFAERYPTIKQVDWDTDSGNYEAEFKLSGLERTALFTADGKLVSYTEEIDQRHLPKTILETLQANYANYKLDEAHRLQQDGNSRYVVELEDNMDELELHFDASGKIIEQQASAKVNKQEASLLPAKFLSKTANTLGEPSERWELPANLREVSGIALLPDGLIACVQDEEGAIHLFDPVKKQVTDKISFAGPGDYEGISLIGQDAFILRSDGTLLEVQNFRNGKPAVTEHKTVLAGTQNTEGLAYDAKNNRLLLACKGFDTKLGDSKGIYTFSLSSKTMQQEPVFHISLAQDGLTSTKKKKKNKYDVLQPSSFEIHPVTGDLYLLDAVNSRLHIINEQGKILKTTQLDKKLLRQPEGMTFSDKGELYIASEGGTKGKGVIVKFAQGI
ncbi:SdiA-regulated domain-containing protein [Pontibacter sp. KCTC 32443]|uniref:SdiA-regulated domain-containing protein n=1 Tax=Pontibacter TaxID=323449 RepID=UPI00164E546A|nr:MULTISPECIES: SdiA-regulated domain-containing protein [Pontibacter]MBC5773296.1 SdiA-regulated domain-containing protein [Pontibacter sp. KCTC 32443]